MNRPAAPSLTRGTRERLRVWILAGLALVVSASAGTPGLTWDEPTYLQQSLHSADWLARAVTLNASSTEPIWITPDHPPLAKLVYGLAARAFEPVMPALAAARLVSAFLFAALAGLTTLAATRCFGRRAGWLAGGSVILMPQVVAHSRLAALDLPMAVAWLAAAVISLVGPTGWAGAALLGFVWGLALLTKVNGLFLIVPLLVWGVAERRIRWREVPLVVAIGVLTFWVGWPWLWHDTAANLQTYVLNKQARWIVPTLYLGRVYNETYPPWHYPLVMTAVTLPPALLIGLVIGSWKLLRERLQGSGWVALHLLFTLGLACLPDVPRYDGTRLFLPAFPFLAMISGVGFDHLFHRAAASERLGVAAAWVVILLAAGSAAASIHAVSPCLLSSYSPLVGGPAGAEHLGLETTFWADAVTPDLLRQIPPGARVGAAPMGEDYVRALQAAGLLPAGATPAPEANCDVLIVVGRKGMLTEELRRRFDTEPALAETRRGGVALARLLRR